MKPRTLLILFLVVAALGAFIWFVERDLPSTDERAERARRVLPLESEEVTAVEILHGEGRVRLVRDGSEDVEGDDGDGEGDWLLTEPLAARADGEAVAELLESLTGLEKERTLEEFDGGELGLENPRAEIRLTTGDREWRLKVGEAVPASSSLVVALAEGDEAFVVSDAFEEELEKEPGEWRSRRAFPTDRERIASLRFESGDRSVRLERADGSFRLTEPVADEADREKVDELLDAVADLEIEEFLDPPVSLPALGLEPSRQVVEVGLEGGGEVVEIHLGEVADENGERRYAAVGGQAFTTESELAALLEGSSDDWRSRAWSRFRVYEVDSIRARQGDREMTLKRSEGDWLRDGTTIPYTAASDLLYAVRDLAAAGLRPADETTKAAPVLELELTAGESSESLTIRPVEEGSFVAERRGRDALLEVGADGVDDLLEKLQAVRDAEPIPDGEAPSDSR